MGPLTNDWVQTPRRRELSDSEVSRVDVFRSEVMLVRERELEWVRKRSS